VQFSFQLSNLDNATQDVSIWFRKNASDPYHVVAAMNYFVDLAKDDYVEIMWSTTNTSVTIDTKPTRTSPTRPATPSAIVTMQYVSTDGYTTDIFQYPYVSSYGKGEATITHHANSTADLTYRYIVVG
jgi:hypothetical protein